MVDPQSREAPLKKDIFHKSPGGISEKTFAARFPTEQILMKKKTPKGSLEQTPGTPKSIDMIIFGCFPEKKLVDTPENHIEPKEKGWLRRWTFFICKRSAEHLMFQLLVFDGTKFFWCLQDHLQKWKKNTSTTLLNHWFS